MTLKPSKLLFAGIALAAGVALGLPASAEPSKPVKPKKPESAAASRPVQTSYRGTDKFRTGPLYNGQDYLGDDPDPFIRMMIQRDLSARYGGNE